MNKVPVFSSGAEAAATFNVGWRSYTNNSENEKVRVDDSDVEIDLTPREKTGLLKVVDQAASDLKLGGFAIFAEEALNKIEEYKRLLAKTWSYYVELRFQPAAEIAKHIQDVMQHKMDVSLV